MIWFTLSLATAFFMATNSAFLKRFFSDVSPWDMAVIPFFWATPFCIVGLFFIDIPEILPGFYSAMAWVFPLTMVGFILHFRAVSISPLSLTLPFLSFTPAFVLVTGRLVLNEHLSPIGIAGIVLVVVGGYVINMDARKYGLLGPVKAIWREPGSAIMLLVAAIYAMTSVGGKVILMASSPLFGALSQFVLYGVAITILLVGTGKARMGVILGRPGLGILSGLFLFAEVVTHNLAISMVEAAYMITIKRMAGIFSVIYGWVLFRERGILYRFLGAAIMTAGAAVIGIWG